MLEILQNINFSGIAGIAGFLPNIGNKFAALPSKGDYGTLDSSDAFISIIPHFILSIVCAGILGGKILKPMLTTKGRAGKITGSFVLIGTLLAPIIIGCIIGVFIGLLKKFANITIPKIGQQNIIIQVVFGVICGWFALFIAQKIGGAGGSAPGYSPMA